MRLKFQGRSSTILYKPSIKINLSTSPSLVSTLDVFFFQLANFQNQNNKIYSHHISTLNLHQGLGYLSMGLVPLTKLQPLKHLLQTGRLPKLK